MIREVKADQRLFLSTEPAGKRVKVLAAGVVLASGIFFLLAVPFAKVPLVKVPAFVAAYEVALVICDLVTAVILLTQFNFIRSRALLILACGYLFTAMIALAHALSYPDLFASHGLLGGGPQTTAWLYFFWHGGFPAFVIAYALSNDLAINGAGSGLLSPSPLPTALDRVVIIAITGVFASVAALTLLSTTFHNSLPVLMSAGRFESRLNGLPSGVSLLSLVALVLLWRRRPHTVLDIWLMVVMIAWFFNMALGAVFNLGRFDFGFYAGRIYGFLASSFVLGVLLFENSVHYSGLVRMAAALGVANRALDELSRHDGLTGLANRRFFDSYLAEQLSIADRHQRDLALILYDVDAFKAFNDRYGHVAGDGCLRDVATALKGCCGRPGDMVARYGGEEFAMVLPDTDFAGAETIAEGARNAVVSLGRTHCDSPAAAFVTISGGVALHRRGTTCTATELISNADGMLYDAKRLGRNRIVVCPAAA